MDLLSQHEAFLRAIFDAPEDDTLRLVSADFLEENGEENHAAFIRVSVELSQRFTTTPSREESAAWEQLGARRDALLRKLSETCPDRFRIGPFVRGFPRPHRVVTLTTSELANPGELRVRMRNGMGCFGATEASIQGPRLLTGHAFDALFTLSALMRVTHLNLSGTQETVRGVEDGVGGLRVAGFEYVIVPVVSVHAVEALVCHRGVRRLTVLDLRNNNLDNDAARALVKSPYLDNLTQLDLFEGNRFRGRVWQQVVERFGEDAVG